MQHIDKEKLSCAKFQKKYGPIKKVPTSLIRKEIADGGNIDSLKRVILGKDVNIDDYQFIRITQINDKLRFEKQ